MEDIRKQWNDACLSSGIDALTLDTSAKIMAILMEYGNNEGFVYSSHFRADCEYIQKRYRLQGGETPDERFVERFQRYATKLTDTPPQWAKDLIKNMYNIEI